MTRPDLRALAERERAALLDLLEELTVDQWNAPSLCEAWTVRDVAVHIVSYDELSTSALAVAFLRGGLRVSSVNEFVLRQYADLGPAGVVDLVARTRSPRGLTAAMRCGIALTDATIHHQDIRRALGLPRRIPEDQLRAALDFAVAAPTLPARKNIRRLRLVASDQDWATGSGDAVTGPSEALLMAAVGRADALSDLAGDGHRLLSARVSSG